MSSGNNGGDISKSIEILSTIKNLIKSKKSNLLGFKTNFLTFTVNKAFIYL